MPVTYVGASSQRSNGSNSSVPVTAHGSEQPGDVAIQAWFLPAAASPLTPDTPGWVPVLEADTSVGPFALWLYWQVSTAQDTEWSWDGSTSLFGGLKLIVRGADTNDPLQVGPLLSGADSGQTLSLPSMTPLEAGGMAAHFLTARYSTGASTKSIGAISGYTMTTAQTSTQSSGHAIRLGRRDNVPANTATGNVSATATATTTGWRALSVVVREPRPWVPQNKQFHTHA